MKNLIWSPMLAACILTACTQPSTEMPDGTASPEAFVRTLFSDDQVLVERGVDPSGVYSARTAALFAENDRLHEGYAGYPDADPICDCQDSDDLAVTRATTQIVDADRARVGVVLNNGQSHTFVLIREGGNWRVDDVEGLSGGPLVAGLKASNAEARLSSTGG
jgi:hypothetical protein